MNVLGKWHELNVVKIDRDFVYLNHPQNLEEEIENITEVDGEEVVEMITQPVLIEMAHNQTTKLLKEKETVKVFLYNKKEGFIAASMNKPLVELNRFAYLRFVGSNNFAHFADMGLDADLFIHKNEEGLQPETGKKYIVSMRLDEMTGKLNGQMDLERLLSRKGARYKKGEEVACQIIGKTEGGFKINIEDKYWGYLRAQDVVSHSKMGTRFRGYIEDSTENSLIVTMQPTGEQSIKDAAHKILMLVQEKKYVRLTEDSDPEEIKLRLKMSKKTFKKAVGNLEKQNLISVTKRGIKLVKTEA